MQEIWRPYKEAAKMTNLTEIQLHRLRIQKRIRARVTMDGTPIVSVTDVFRLTAK